MKKRIKALALTVVIILTCALFLTACGVAPISALPNYSDNSSVLPKQPDDTTGGDLSCENDDRSDDVAPSDEAVQNPPKSESGSQSGAEVSDPSASIPPVPTETDVTSDANTVTVTYSTTYGGYIRGKSEQTVELGAYTEEVSAVTLSYSHPWWKFVKWSDGVTTQNRSDRADKSFTVTAIFELDGEADGDFRFRLLPDGKGYEVAYENVLIAKATIPDFYKGLPVKEVAEGGFRNCYELTYLYIPQTVVKIGKGAYRYCRKLEIAEGMVNVKEIGNQAFDHCEELKRVTGLQKVEYHGYNVFSQCINLEYVVFSDTIEYTTSSLHVGLRSENKPRVFFIRKTQTEMRKLFDVWFYASSPKSKVVYIGAEGKPSDEYELKDRDELFDFTLTDDGTGYSVSLRDAGATEALIPSHYNGLPVTEIAERGFADSGVVTAYIPYTVKTIGKNAFSQCGNLLRVVGFDEVESIGDEAFANCPKLSPLVLPETLQKVGARILRDNHSPLYTRIMIGEIPELSPEWNNDRFTGGAVYIGDGMPDERFELIYYKTGSTLAEVAALGKTISHAEIPFMYNGLRVLSIKDGGFANCVNLETINLDARMSRIGAEAFCNCVKLKRVYGSQNISAVGASAFKNCPNLDIVLSNGVIIEKA